VFTNVTEAELVAAIAERWWGWRGQLLSSPSLLQVNIAALLPLFHYDFFKLYANFGEQ
jgi:hypothetical protein